MTLIRADQAGVEWNPEKKHWQVVLTVGAEVIKRPIPKQPRDASDATLQPLAVETAKDEGYEVDAARVTVAR